MSRWIQCHQLIRSRFLHQLQSWAKETGIDRLELTVMSTHRGARSLYEHHGFKLEKIKREAIRVAGESIDERVMGKLVTPGPPGC